MKKLIAVVFLLLLSVSITPNVNAVDYERGFDDHPLRILGYILYPLGMLGEYAICRPVHALVSLNSNTKKIFGYSGSTEDISFKWE